MQMKELLTLVTTVPGQGGSGQQGMSHPQAGAVKKQGSCLMDMLMTVQALQYPLLDLLLDVMLMCCQHLIMLEGQSWDLNDSEEEDQLEDDAVTADQQAAERDLATCSQDQSAKLAGSLALPLKAIWHSCIVQLSTATIHSCPSQPLTKLMF